MATLRPLFLTLSLVGAAAGLPAVAAAQAGFPPPPPQPQGTQPPGEIVPPPAQPPPAAGPPAPPPAAVPGPAPASAANGEWVYTGQYGWVWMTYGEATTYVPPDGTGEPLQYVYYPAYGWRWVVAPWVWGIGPWPHFVHGPARFAWYQHGWWRTPSRWHYRPAEIRGEHGVRAAPPRPAPHAAHRAEAHGHAEGHGHHER